MTAAPRNASCPLWVRARLKGVPSRCYGMYNVNLSSIGQIIPSQRGFSLCVSSLLDAGQSASMGAVLENLLAQRLATFPTVPCC